jgi:hypothetical protein
MRVHSGLRSVERELSLTESIGVWLEPGKKSTLIFAAADEPIVSALKVLSYQRCASTPVG